MKMQQQSLIGYGGYTPEQLHAIVQRAHRERARAVGEFFSGLFKRRKSAAQEPRRAVRRLQLSAAK